MAKPPVRAQRQDLQTASGVPAVDEEVRAQVEHRARREARRRREKRPRMTYDLPLVLIERVRGLAEEEEIAQSDLVAWAVISFLVAYEAGEVDLEAHKVHARSLRFRYRLELPDLPEDDETRKP